MRFESGFSSSQKATFSDKRELFSNQSEQVTVFDSGRFFDPDDNAGLRATDFAMAYVPPAQPRRDDIIFRDQILPENSAAYALEHRVAAEPRYNYLGTTEPVLLYSYAGRNVNTFRKYAFHLGLPSQYLKNENSITNCVDLLVKDETSKLHEQYLWVKTCFSDVLGISESELPGEFLGLEYGKFRCGKVSVGQTGSKDGEYLVGILSRFSHEIGGPKSVKNSVVLFLYMVAAFDDRIAVINHASEGTISKENLAHVVLKSKSKVKCQRVLCYLQHVFDGESSYRGRVLEILRHVTDSAETHGVAFDALTECANNEDDWLDAFRDRHSGATIRTLLENTAPRNIMHCTGSVKSQLLNWHGLTMLDKAEAKYTKKKDKKRDTETGICSESRKKARIEKDADGGDSEASDNEQGDDSVEETEAEKEDDSDNGSETNSKSIVSEEDGTENVKDGDVRNRVSAQLVKFFKFCEANGWSCDVAATKKAVGLEDVEDTESLV